MEIEKEINEKYLTAVIIHLKKHSSQPFIERETPKSHKTCSLIRGNRISDAATATSSHLEQMARNLFSVCTNEGPSGDCAYAVLSSCVRSKFKTLRGARCFRCGCYFFCYILLLKCVSSWQQQRHDEEKRQVNISTTAGAASAACQVTCNLWQANNKNKHDLMLLTHVRAEHPNPSTPAPTYIYGGRYVWRILIC